MIIIIILINTIIINNYYMIIACGKLDVPNVVAYVDVGSMYCHLTLGENWRKSSGTEIRAYVALHAHYGPSIGGGVSGGGRSG